MPKRVKAGLANKTLKFLDYLIVIDFECTCVEILYDYPHEIIEFPAVIVDVKELKITKEFRSFVKPTVNPILDPFCIKLTHITQEQVDSAPPFDAVLKQFFEWMQKNGLFEPNVRFAFVTDGPHDIWKFLQFQCEILCNIKMPHIFRPYINMKKFFETKFEAIQKGQGKSSLDIMLEYFDLGFEGSKHSGIDDARNIARIVIQMMKTGVEFRVSLQVNERCASKKHRNERNENYQNPSRNKNQLSDMHIWRKKLRLTSVNVARKESEPGKLLPCSSCEDLDDINTLSTRQASLLVRQEMLKNRTKRLDEVAFDGANCDQSDLPPDPEEGYEQQIVDHETSVQASKNYVCQRVKTANDAGFQFSRNLKVLMPPKLFLNE